ncbi:hypothetical protein E4T43_08425 [Aureobasidium subglaciale]|nr:hypothetical protein E4T43_08425 [Aureobasidium subglaciale]
MGRHVRVPATKACDYCRLRKIKCLPAEDASKSACKPCFAGGLECSYIIPTKRRGPPPKKRKIIGISPTSNTDSPALKSYACTTTTDAVSIPVTDLAAADSSSSNLRTCLVHRLVNCSSFNTIMRDYLDVLYALIPVVHIPTFKSELEAGKHIYDMSFQMFCLSICACVFGILPHNFDEYITADPAIEFTDRRTAIADIHRAITAARPAEFYDTLTHEKWASLYLMSVTNAHLGHRNRAKLLFAECNAIATEMGMHRMAGYRELDHIETQLRKKAFWLCYTGWSHMRTRDVDWDSMGDRCRYETADAEHLIPLELDDEYITVSEIHQQPTDTISLVTGFNALIRVSDCLVPIFKDPELPMLSYHAETPNIRNQLGVCGCGRLVSNASMSSSILARLVKSSHVLDDLPLQLSAWSSSGTASDPQFETMTANIHVTHVWVQNLLLERFLAAQAADSSAKIDSCTQRLVWDMRETICRQLMDILNNISESNLKPNGYVLIGKARSVAAGLLDCCPEGDDTTIERARTYLQNYADILARLDEGYRKDFTPNLWKEFHGR